MTQIVNLFLYKCVLAQECVYINLYFDYMYEKEILYATNQDKNICNQHPRKNASFPKVHVSELALFGF